MTYSEKSQRDLTMKHYEYITYDSEVPTITRVIADSILDAHLQYNKKTGKRGQDAIVYLIVKELIHDGYSNADAEELFGEAKIKNSWNTQVLGNPTS